MRRVAIHAGLGLLALLAPPPAVVAQTPAPAGQEEPTADQTRASVAAVRDANAGRLMGERAYAEEMVGHLDRLQRLLPNDVEARLELDNVRLFALVGLRRPDEARALIDWMLTQRSRDPNHYFGAWVAALSFEDVPRALALVEMASQNVPGVRWAGLREAFKHGDVSFLLRRLAIAEDEAGRVRLARALFRFGWPGDDPSYSDVLRGILLDDALRRGERVEAQGLAAAISAPSKVAALIVQRRYDVLFPDGTDRIARLRQALAGHDRQTAAALAAAPRHKKRVLERAQFLRTLGRDADALALLEPFMADVAATAADEDGMWLVNEAAYAMIELGRGDEAVRLMGPLVALPVAESGYLISASINYGEMLWEASRYADSLAHARLLERDFSQYASDYGDMWIRATIVCALASLGRGGEAAPTLEQMRAQTDKNPAALMRAYLCLDDMASAEALVISRLEGDDPEEAVLALQDYLPGNPASGPDRLIERLMSLRERPRVRAALDRAGRVLQLPVARTYWGGV